MDNRTVTSTATLITVSGGSLSNFVTPSYIISRLVENTDYEILGDKFIKWLKSIVYNNQIYHNDTGWSYYCPQGITSEFQNGSSMSGTEQVPNGAKYYVESPQRIIDYEGAQGTGVISWHGVTVNVVSTTGSGDFDILFILTAQVEWLSGVITIINNADLPSRAVFAAFRGSSSHSFNFKLIGAIAEVRANYGHRLTGEFYPGIDLTGAESEHVYLNFPSNGFVNMNSPRFLMSESNFVRFYSTPNSTVRTMALTNPYLTHSFGQLQINSNDFLVVDITSSVHVVDANGNNLSNTRIAVVSGTTSFSDSEEQLTSSEGRQDITLNSVYQISGPGQSNVSFPDTSMVPSRSFERMVYYFRKYGYIEGEYIAYAVPNGRGIDVNVILNRDLNIESPTLVPNDILSIEPDGEIIIDTATNSFLNIYERYQFEFVALIENRSIGNDISRLDETYNVSNNLRLEDSVNVRDDESRVIFSAGHDVITGVDSQVNFMYENDTLTSNRVLIQINSNTPEVIGPTVKYSVRQISSSDNISLSPESTVTVNSIARHNKDLDLYLYLMNYNSRITVFRSRDNLATHVAQLTRLQSLDGVSIESVRSNYDLLHPVSTYDFVNKTLVINYDGLLSTNQILQYMQYVLWLDFTNYVDDNLNTAFQDLHPFDFNGRVFSAPGLTITPGDDLTIQDPNVIWDIEDFVGSNADGQNVIYHDSVDVMSVEVTGLGAFKLKILDVTNDTVVEDFRDVTVRYTNQVNIGTEYRIVVTANGYRPAIINHEATTAGNKILITLQEESNALTSINTDDVPDISDLEDIFTFTSDTITFDPSSNVRASRNQVYTFFHSVKQTDAYLDYLLDINSQDVITLHDDAVTFSRIGFTLQINNGREFRVQLDAYFGYSMDSTTTINPANNEHFAVQIDGYNHGVTDTGIEIAVRTAITRAGLLTESRYLFLR